MGVPTTNLKSKKGQCLEMLECMIGKPLLKMDLNIAPVDFLLLGIGCYSANPLNGYCVPGAD